MNLAETERETFMVAVYSTVHITKDDNEILERLSDMGYSAGQDDFGHWVWLGSEKEEDYDTLEKAGASKAFLNLVCDAKARRCRYLRLDRDEEVYTDLETFDW